MSTTKLSNQMNIKKQYMTKFNIYEGNLSIIEKAEKFGVEITSINIKSKTPHLVSTSGGMDSQACLKLIKENYGSVCLIFADTGFEHPDTYTHLHTLIKHYDCDHIFFRKKNSDVLSEIVKNKKFPSGKTRFCTSSLKQNTSKIIEACYANEVLNPIVYIGIRGDESPTRKAKYSGMLDWETFKPHEIYSNRPKYLYYRYGVTMTFPLIEMKRSDVVEVLKNDPINPLYEKGMNSVGCFPCLIAGKKEIEKAFALDEFGLEQKQKVFYVSEKIGRKLDYQEKNQKCEMCKI